MGTKEENRYTTNHMITLTVKKPKGFQKGHKGFIPKWKYPSIAKKISASKMGVKLSEDHKMRLREGSKGKGMGNKNGFKKGFTPWNKGLVKENAITRQVGYGAIKNQKRRARKMITGGSHTLNEWQNLRAKYNFTCPSCNKPEPFNQKYKYLTEDHITPISKGGSDNIENIQPLCLSCNDIKNVKIIKYA
jgi:hypothetical protein